MKDLKFNGLTMEQRLKAALDQTIAAMQALVPFLVSLQPGRTQDSTNTKLQCDAVRNSLLAIRELLETLLLDHLLAAYLIHMFGPPLPADATEDARNLRAMREVHFILDWLAGVAPSDSLDAVRTDLKRLEERHEPRTLRRDSYADPRVRDELEKAEREFAVLLTYFIAGAKQEKIPVLLARLGVNYDAIRRWAAEIDKEQRELLAEAGRLSAAGGGLPLAKAARLSERSRDVLLRDDRDRFPGLAGRDDEAKLRKLFDLVRRSGSFSSG
jgi:hypothetical protein